MHLTPRFFSFTIYLTAKKTINARTITEITVARFIFIVSFLSAASHRPPADCMRKPVCSCYRQISYAACAAALVFWCRSYFSSKLARIFLEIMTIATTMTAIAISPGTKPLPR